MSYGDHTGPRTRQREPFPNERYRKPRNLTRWRILAFLAALVAIEVAGIPSPWGMILGVAVYLAVVFPALPRSRP
jgi:hypothetical protein